MGIIGIIKASDIRKGIKPRVERIDEGTIRIGSPPPGDTAAYLIAHTATRSGEKYTLKSQRSLRDITIYELHSISDLLYIFMCSNDSPNYVDETYLRVIVDCFITGYSFAIANKYDDNVASPPKIRMTIDKILMRINSDLAAKGESTWLSYTKYHGSQQFIVDDECAGSQYSFTAIDVISASCVRLYLTVNINDMTIMVTNSTGNIYGGRYQISEIV